MKASTHELAVRPTPLPAGAQSVLSFAEARAVVENYARQLRPAGEEKVSLPRALARFLAAPICADRDLPPFSRSTRDGFAVRTADLAQLPARLKIVGEIKAGAPPDAIIRNLLPGEAIAIMTGAPVPVDADAVLMQEHTTAIGDGLIETSRSLAAGENIVPRGAEAVEDQVLLSPGARLTPARLAVAATVGCASLSVYRRPQVAVLTTGDEIVPVHSFPGPTQIRNSNLYSLAAQIELAGGETVPLPVAPDEPRRLRELVATALQYDLALLTGGVSLGKYDLVEQVLQELEAQFFFTGIRIQPGRPLVFGDAPAQGKKARQTTVAARASASLKPKRIHNPSRQVGAGFHPSAPKPGAPGTPGARRVPFFGLPGNPVSTMVTFELFVAPILRALAGGEVLSPRFVCARLKSPFRTPTGLTRFLPAKFSGGPGPVEVELLNWQGSGDVVANSQANCFLVVPPDREQISAGEEVNILIPSAELK
jgi:molybdopterin molybdotransferase